MPRKPPTVAEKYKQGKRKRASPSSMGYDRRRHLPWRRAVLERDHYICQCAGEHCKHHDGPCGQAGKQADHIVPLTRGGDWSLENGQAMCVRCHSVKTARELRGG